MAKDFAGTPGVLLADKEAPGVTVGIVANADIFSNSPWKNIDKISLRNRYITLPEVVEGAEVVQA